VTAPPAWAMDETNLFLLLQHYQNKQPSTVEEYTANALRELKEVMTFALLYTGLPPLQEGARGLTMLQRKGTSMKDEWTGILTEEEAQNCFREMESQQLRQYQVNHFFRRLELSLQRTRSRR
jgi:hypothetical protein